MASFTECPTPSLRDLRPERPGPTISFILLFAILMMRILGLSLGLAGLTVSHAHADSLIQHLQMLGRTSQ